MKVLSIFIQTQQPTLAQFKAFGRSRCTIGKPNRINAELVVRLMTFRPETRRRLPRGEPRDLTTLMTVCHAMYTKPVARNIYANDSRIYRGSRSFPSNQRFWSAAIA